jgi:hypothetical protein
MQFDYYEHEPLDHEPNYDYKDSVEKTFVKLKNQINLSHADLIYFEYQANEIFKHFNWYIHDWIRSNPNYPQLMNPLPRFYLKRILCKPKTQVNKLAQINKEPSVEISSPIQQEPEPKEKQNSSDLMEEINTLRKQLEHMKEEVLNFKTTFQTDLNKVKETYKPVTKEKPTETSSKEIIAIDDLLNSIRLEDSIIKINRSMVPRRKDKVKELLIKLHSKIKHKKISEIISVLTELTGSLFTAYIGLSDTILKIDDQNLTGGLMK